MNYYGAKELAQSFRTVRNNTIMIAGEIPEDQYGFRPAEGCQSVGELFSHIAVMPQVQEQIHVVQHCSALASFDFRGLMSTLQAEVIVPRTKAEILDLLRSEGDRFAAILEGASEEFLGEQVEYPEGMMPRTKSRFEMLMGAKEHEMHHRGQLMLIQRLLGITPHMTRQMEQRLAALKAQASQ